MCIADFVLFSGSRPGTKQSGYGALHRSMDQWTMDTVVTLRLITKTSSWSVFKYEDHPKRRLERQSLNIMKIQHVLVWNLPSILETDQSTTVCNCFIQAHNAAVHTF